MDAGTPSRTAQGAAMHRAAHQLLDAPLVFEDPLAIRVVGSEAEAELRSGKNWHGLRSNGMRAFIAVRSRVAEDCLAEAIARGTSQYVLLGAGLDTFAYRHPGSRPELRIFEVDHPSTQAWKRSRLAEANIPAGANITYVPIDFEVDSLGERLTACGFDFTRPAACAWLGVTPYLPRETVLATLRYFAGAMARGSDIIFDFAEPDDGRDPAHTAAIAALAERVASLGEPLRSFFEPDLFRRELPLMGYTRIRDLDADALNTTYFTGRPDDLYLRGRGHVIVAGT